MKLPFPRRGRRRRRRGTERRPGRFQRMIGNHVLWPAIGSAALAVGLGVQLGASTIREINPIHFQGPPIHPRDRGAAIDPAALRPPAQSAYAQAYGWGEGERARAAASGYEDFDFAPPPIVRRAADASWQQEAAPLALPPWPRGEVSAHPEIERYTDYPIEQRAADEPAPAKDEDEASDETEDDGE